MNPNHIFNKSKKLPYDEMEARDLWASNKLESAANLLLKHYEKSSIELKGYRTLIFEGASGCFKKLSIAVGFTWREEYAGFELSCPYYHCASGLFTRADIWLYTNHPLTNELIHTSLDKVLQFRNRIALYKFLAKNYTWFTESFFKPGYHVDCFSPNISLDDVYDINQLGIDEKLRIGKHIAIDKVKDLLGY